MDVPELFGLVRLMRIPMGGVVAKIRSTEPNLCWSYLINVGESIKMHQ